MKSISIVATGNDPSVRFRLPKQLLAVLNEAAVRSCRSRNTEMCVRLAESLGVEISDISRRREGMAKKSTVSEGVGT